VGDALDQLPNASEIDTVWMTAALRRAAVAGAAEVVEISARSIGTGQVGENVRFELVWDRDDPTLPGSVVGKFPSGSEVSRASARAVGTYVREVGFYRDLQRHVSMRTPNVHHLGWDPETHDFVLLMEDVREAEQGDQLTGCSLDRAALVVDEAVGLHAPTWGRTDDWRDLEWLGFPEPARAELMAGLTRWALPGFTERFAARLSADDLAVGERVIGAYETWAGLAAAWAADHGGWCIVHADYRLDNMLFATAPGAPPVTIVDWQTVTVGTGPADVAYFLGAGLSSHDRAAHERDLVADYAARLRGVGIELSDAAAWDGYVIGSAGGYVMAVIASQLVERTTRGDEMFAVMAERHAAQIRDVGLLDLL
jgi:hypothetical protein